MAMTACEDEVLRIGKKFEKMVQGTKSMDGALDLLETLSALPINISVLTKTRIGMTINDLRKKANDEKVSKRAKALIKEWKSLLENKGDKGVALKVASLPRNDSSSSSLCEKDQGKIYNQSTSGLNNKPNGATKRLLGDEVRNKCATMILDALAYRELPEDALNPEDLALRIENKLFEIHRGTTDKYKAGVRSRVFNLRDKKNIALRENVLVGVVTPERFATMTSDEMASDEMKKQREKFTKEAIDEHQIGEQEGTPSDMFKCGKCGKKNCTYTQVQTRSADEPMTTFVFCRECGNRWKFS